MGGISGEFLNRNRPNLTLAARAGRQLEAERHRQRVDVQAAPGRQVRQRPADDRRRRRRDLQPPAHRSDLAGRLGVQRRPLGCRRHEGRRLHRAVQAGQRRRRASRTSRARRPTRRSSCPRTTQGPFESKPQTTGAFNLVSYTPGVSAKYDRNPNWWGGSAPLDGVDVTLGEQTALNNALIGGQLDLLNGIVYFDSRALFSNPNIQIFSARGATHREIPMRVDQADSPLKDPRVRRAIALTLNRPQIVKTLFNGKADLGNDSPFAPVYPSTAGRPAAPPGHPPGQASSSRRPVSRRASRRSSSPTRRPSCRASRRSSSRARSRSAARSTSRSSPARSTTRARRPRRRG